MGVLLRNYSINESWILIKRSHQIRPNVRPKTASKALNQTIKAKTFLSETEHGRKCSLVGSTSALYRENRKFLWLGTKTSQRSLCKVVFWASIFGQGSPAAWHCTTLAQYFCKRSLSRFMLKKLILNRDSFSLKSC